MENKRYFKCLYIGYKCYKQNAVYESTVKDSVSDTSVLEWVELYPDHWEEVYIKNKNNEN